MMKFIETSRINEVQSTIEKGLWGSEHDSIEISEKRVKLFHLRYEPVAVKIISNSNTISRNPVQNARVK